MRAAPAHLLPSAPCPSFVQNGETAPDPLPEEKDNINGMQLLSMEATGVNQAFREQARQGRCVGVLQRRGSWARSCCR